MVLILLIAAFILFVLATLGAGAPRFACGWAGLACLALAELLPVVGHG